MNHYDGFKPYQLVWVKEDGYGYVGEVMSFVTPEHTVMVRRVPGHPGALQEQGIHKVERMDPEQVRRCKWVHYATVAGAGSFPVDMLRYDRCAPVNFTLDEHDRPVVDPDAGFGDVPLVATIAPTSIPPWTYARWSSFLWGVKPFGEALRN